ncbi:MAG: nucleotidyl transferase AbiEii/AbiGii toxin family protein [Nitrospinae bacterium]|nr:nucleotidyl transferase AbiEii/AbiGii toxin family protein [Nitrospinota bacterium]
MLYSDVFRELARRKARYLVVGGFAVNLLGAARLSMDLDIMVDLAPDNMAGLVAAMESLGFVPRQPVETADLLSPMKREEWIREKRAVVFSFVDDGFRSVDVFLKNPVDFEAAYQGRVMFEMDGAPVACASAGDIITMKRIAGRPRDLEDIAHLEKLRDKEGRHGA